MRLITVFLSCLPLILAAQPKENRFQKLEMPGSPISSGALKITSSDVEISPLKQRNFVPTNLRKTERRQEEKQNAVKVTFTFPAYDEEWKFSTERNNLLIYNNDGFYEAIEIPRYDENWEPLHLSSYEYMLPEGTYDCFASFERINPDMYWGVENYIFYIVENAEITEGSIIELKPEESTIYMAMETTNPDGEKTRFRKISYDENWNFEIIEEGNVVDSNYEKIVYFHGNIITAIGGNVGGIEVVPCAQGSYNPYAERSIYVNQVSDNYMFRVTNFMPAWPNEENGIYTAVCEALGSKEGEYTNSTYSLENSQILPTPAFTHYSPIEVENEDVYPYGISFLSYGGKTNTVFEAKNNRTWKIWNSGPEHPIKSGEAYYSYSKSLADMAIMTEYGFPLTSKTTTTRITPLVNDVPEMCYFSNYPFNIQEDGKLESITYPGNPAFLGEIEQSLITSGGSAPLLTSYLWMTYDFDSNSPIPYIDGFYNGRLNEIIGSDIRLATCKLTVENYNIEGNFDDIFAWMIENKDVKGKFEIEISTDNFEIDGISGGNRAIVQFDTENSDMLPPSATMLQFRNNSNEVTQIFNEAADGTIMLSACDYELLYGVEYEGGFKQPYFELTQPEMVTAICKPTGAVTESYDEIELTVQPALFYTPGFGAFYEGSLAGVTQKSPTGWFDLTLTVEDAAGNYQTQTLSPAFKIDSLASSVDTVISDSVIVRGNTIIAPADAQIYTIDGVRTNGTNLPTGIYIVCIADRTYKVSVK